ncbi:myrosinase 1-like isoform X1 [Schistocerca gregaria]|uniref:myrosinase 1-like isoform X1 n=1 Tax=Schistocerca gregaria TaxID=7010 RepID=UPI00211DEE37|nr:myrosinase 1-like isoform X1 [Schistocerca gregaria]XP_049840619.1 myrosinase 1-like isoform X1 [Schistocerca gregaria]XP_049840620.1 myrosinase 1-like isoform X1 [Schistocerca gregaria]
MAATASLALAAALLSLAGLSRGSPQDGLPSRDFPPGFMFGAATAAFQIEGAWNLSGKGENIWDRWTHQHPEWVADGSNADVACDSFHRFKEDVQALVDTGFDFYRFSISWSRILPRGTVDYVNEEGLWYYNRLLTELMAHRITPVVTMFHWDLPQPLQDLGGWTNPVVADYFEDYARILFRHFGDRVKYWITINEPASIIESYANSRLGAPGLDEHGVADYQASHTLLKAHAKAYHLYDKYFRKTQKGRVSITLNSAWHEPRTNSQEDRQAAERARQFYFGYWAHPIYSKIGDYPAVMKERIMRNSLAEGRFRSRLPEFSPQWVKFIRGTADFFAYNHYTTRYAASGTQGEIPSLQRDSGVIRSYDPKWPSSASSWLKVVPWGLRKMLNWIKKEYGNLPLLITENGFSDHGGLHDKDRINYFVSYLQELLKAIYIDKCNVFGYTAWSLVDNFEWARGYTEKFGIYQVNFTDPNRARIPKDSAQALRKIIKHRALVPNLLQGEMPEPRVVLVT